MTNGTNGTNGTNPLTKQRLPADIDYIKALYHKGTRSITKSILELIKSTAFSTMQRKDLTDVVMQIIMDMNNNIHERNIRLYLEASRNKISVVLAIQLVPGSVWTGTKHLILSTIEYNEYITQNFPKVQSSIHDTSGTYDTMPHEDSILIEPKRLIVGCIQNFISTTNSFSIKEAKVFGFCSIKDVLPERHGSTTYRYLQNIMYCDTSAKGNSMQSTNGSAISDVHDVHDVLYKAKSKRTRLHRYLYPAYVEFYVVHELQRELHTKMGIYPYHTTKPTMKYALSVEQYKAHDVDIFWDECTGYDRMQEYKTLPRALKVFEWDMMGL